MSSSRSLQLQCVRELEKKLSADLVPQWIRAIGLHEIDHEDIINSNRSIGISETIFQVINRWIMRCGERFTATEKKYLEDVAQEVLSNHRNSDVDEWLATQPRLENCGALKNREIAWLLYSVAKYYHIDDVWWRLVYETLGMTPDQTSAIRNNYSRDSIEQKYRILHLWMKQARLETALDTQRKFESINVGFSAENLREPPGNTPQQVESDNADELMPIQ